MAIRVKATARGYYGQLREPGDVFDVPDRAAVGSWMAPLDAADAAPERGRKGRVAPPEPEAAPAQPKGGEDKA